MISSENETLVQADWLLQIVLFRIPSEVIDGFKL